MHYSNILLGLAFWSPLGMTSLIAPRHANTSYSLSAVEGLAQAFYKTAYLIDTKNYTALDEVMTDNVVYDSSSLGEYGGTSYGLDQVRAALEAAAGDAKVEHLVTNPYLRGLITPTKAHVDVYITLSHWDESALDDITKTYRIFYACDDMWVLQDGAWKMQTSLVRNMGSRVEAPYFGKN